MKFHRNIVRPAQSLIFRASRIVFNGKLIVLACMPKSGSTFISRKLSELPGFKKAGFLPSYDRREQEISESIAFLQAMANPRKHLVAQQHLRCSRNTIEVAQQFNMQFIVLTRNIADCMASWCDHMEKEATINAMSFWTTELLDAAEAKGETRFSLMFRTIAPWYCNFYLSWKYQYDAFPAPLKPVFITYEQFFSDPVNQFKDLVSKIDGNALSHCDGVMQNDSAKTRFNKGERGRGAKMLKSDAAAREASQALYRCYPDIDFDAPLSATNP